MKILELSERGERNGLHSIKKTNRKYRDKTVIF